MTGKLKIAFLMWIFNLIKVNVARFVTETRPVIQQSPVNTSDRGKILGE